METQKKIILDMHGTVYSHSERFELLDSEAIYESVICDLQAQYPEKEEQELEYEAIKMGIEGNGGLPLYFFPSFIDNYDWLAQQLIIIFSNSLVKSSELVFTDYYEKSDDRKKLNIVSILNSADFGSKKDPQTWVKLLKETGPVDYIFEDKYTEKAKEGSANQPQCRIKSAIEQV